MVVSEESSCPWCPEGNLYIVCFFIDAYEHGLQKFSWPAGTKKVVNFYGSSVVTWSNSKDRNNEVQVSLFEWLLKGNFFQVQIPHERLSHMGRSSVPSSLLNEFLSLCAFVSLRLLILFTKFKDS